MTTRTYLNIFACAVLGIGIMTSPVWFSDYVHPTAKAQSVFPIDQLTRNRTCEDGYYALSFDDGPFLGHTDKLVAMLKRLKVPGVFFNVGYQAEKYPELIKAEASIGQIGGHSLGHDDYSKLTPHDVAADIATMETKFPMKLRFFRPPYGASNRVVRNAIKHARLVEAMWTIDTKDFEQPDKISKQEDAVRIAESVQPGGIILLHDGFPSTRAMIPQIVSVLSKKKMCPGKLEATKNVSNQMPGASIDYPFYVKAVKP